jgi:hypothetical protein
MRNTPVTRPHRPAPWALGLFLISSGFALVSLVLMATGYSPF